MTRPPPPPPPGHQTYRDSRSHRNAAPTRGGMCSEVANTRSRHRTLSPTRLDPAPWPPHQGCAFVLASDHGQRYRISQAPSQPAADNSATPSDQRVAGYMPALRYEIGPTIVQMFVV